MIKDFSQNNRKEKKMVSLVVFDILPLPHTVISNSEKLTHPIAHILQWVTQPARHP